MIEIISEMSALSGQQGAWDDLLPIEAAPFSTFAWTHAWYAEFSAFYDEMIVLCFRRAGLIRAFLPLYRLGRELRLAGDISCDYQDLVVGQRDDADEAVAALIEWWRRERKPCVLRFEKTASTGFLLPALRRRMEKEQRLLRYERCFMPCPRVALPGTLDAYLRSLPRKMRGDCRRALKKLDQQLPAVSLDIVDSGPDLERAIRCAAEFHVQKFRRNGRSPLADSRLLGVLERVAYDPEAGFHVSLLRDGDRLMAVDFGFSRGGTYYGYLTGFDEDYRKLAPGKCLLLRRIDAWTSRFGIRELDFLGGDEAYKKGFTGGREYQVCSIRLFPLGFRFLFEWSCLQVIRTAKRRVKAILVRFGWWESFLHMSRSAPGRRSR